MAIQQQQAAGREQQLVEALQGWHQAKDASRRYNRDLLQYGAMAAGGLGVEAGNGGVMAVANAVGTLAWWAPWQLGIMAVISTVVMVVGAVLALRAYGLRRLSESEVERYTNRLIELRPDHFLPDAASLRDS